VEYWDSRFDEGLPLPSFRRFAAASCVVHSDPAKDFNGTIRCLTVPGFGLADTWQVTVSNLVGVAHRQVAQRGLAYARPVVLALDGSGAFDASTTGAQVVQITGMHFGTFEDNAVSSVQYGLRGEYLAQDCRVVFSHSVIECKTAAGVGHQLHWSVTVGNLSSETPTTSYGAPVILNVTGPGAQNASTAGGQDVILTGYNFGTRNEFAVGFVMYSESTASPLTAEPCIMLQDHTMIACRTVPGIGYNMRWVVSIGGQASAPSTVTTSYGPPTITSVTHALMDSEGSVPAVLDSEGGTLLQVVGANFGRAGDARLFFANKPVTSTMYGANGELMFVAPAGSGVSNTVQVMVQDRRSPAVVLRYGAPVITTVSVESGRKNESVVLTITGVNLATVCSSCVASVTAANGSTVLTQALPLCPTSESERPPTPIMCSTTACVSDSTTTPSAPVVSIVRPDSSTVLCQPLCVARSSLMCRTASAIAAGDIVVSVGSLRSAPVPYDYELALPTPVLQGLVPMATLTTPSTIGLMVYGSNLGTSGYVIVSNDLGVQVVTACQCTRQCL
jgi:hypothetical protein